jgi:hypothetical protein
MNINIMFSWPKEYLNIVMGNGYSNPHKKEYSKYRDGRIPIYPSLSRLHNVTGLAYAQDLYDMKLLIEESPSL